MDGTYWNIFQKDILLTVEIYNGIKLVVSFLKTRKVFLK